MTFRAAEWFRADPFDDTIICISEPHVDDWIRANAWLVRGSQHDVLVDCGLGIAPLRDFVCALAGREPTVVLTHAHLDHMGSAHEFAACWGHRLEPFDHPATGSLSGPILREELGLTAPLPPLLVTAVPSPDFDPASYRVRPARMARWLDDGDVIDLGDRRLSVLHLPGHTPGSIALLDSDNGVLLSGDVVYDGQLLDDIIGADGAAYRQSMARLLALDVRTVLPGHGPAFGAHRLHELGESYLRGQGS